MNKVREYWWKFKYLCWRNSDRISISLPQNKPRCFIFLAADYGNLGDIAITYAQKKFLQAHYPHHEVIEIPCAKTLSLISSVKKQICKDDIITVVGGGNMGDMYFDIELLRLLVVKNFPNNRIILFPQTIDYSDSKEAKTLLELSQKIYGRQENLVMTAREKVSFEKMKTYYPTVDVRLTPDIVMGFEELGDEIRENRVLFCLRNDKEKNENNNLLIREIREYIESLNFSSVEFDTHIGGGRFSEEEKYSRLKELWREFRKSKLVVTDRLHGMIFAFITGTPALILSNSNFKVKECYHWLESNNYLYLITSTKNFNLKIDNSLSLNEVQRIKSFEEISTYLKRELLKILN